MGEKNPILQQRRGTATGYAFSEDSMIVREDVQQDHQSVEIMEEQRPDSPLLDPNNVLRDSFQNCEVKSRLLE